MKKIAAILLCALLIFLAFPLTAVNTSAAFSGTDKITIVLDPGHGGFNTGAATRGIAEKTYTFRLANLIKAELEMNGSFNVYLSRTGDYDMELYERAEVANRYNADLLISLHFDGNPSPSVHGVTTYTSVFDAYAATSLSSSIASEISAATGLTNNGVRRRPDNAGYYWNHTRQWDCQDPSLGVLSDYYGIPTWCAKFGIKSIIVEHGYFSNYNDSNIICADGALEKIAKAEARAIINYYTNHTHVYSAAKQDFPSNCVYTGKMSERCSVCGHRRNITLLSAAPTNHYWVTKENTPASCGRDGRLVLECRITQNLKDKGWAGDVHMSTETIPAPMDHTFELIKDVKATHASDGYQTWKCKTCQSSFTETVKAEGHTYEFESYTAPTCTANGGSTYKCTTCTATYTDTEGALGHSFTVTDKKDPTCQSEGYADKVCSVCSHKERETFPPLGHSLPESAVKAPTCTEDGSKKGNCLRCDTAIDEVTEKTGHSFQTTINTPPTCTEKGNETKTCTVCAYSEEALTEATGHSFDRTVSEKATCEKDGTAILTCSVCSHVESEPIKALGHKKSEKPISKTEATALSTGAVEYSCENGCEKIFKEEIAPSLDKSEKLIIIAAAALAVSAILVVAVIILIKKGKKKDEESPEKPASAEEVDTPEETEETEETSQESEEESEESEELPEKVEAE